MLIAALVAAPLVTLHCEAVFAHRRDDPPVEFAVTVDYDTRYAYFTGYPTLFEGGVETTAVTVTPGAISLGSFERDFFHGVQHGSVSRTDGKVVLVVHMPPPEGPDYRRAVYQLEGTCRPGPLVPVPSARF